jgi:hypothetical protein
MIEKKIPGSEYFAPLIYATYNIYQDLVQLENQGDLGKITEINANVVTWPCVSTQGANAHELIDWITEHLSDPPMDLIWCPDKPHGSDAPDMFTASLLYATWQVGTPPVLGHAQSLCPLVLFVTLCRGMRGNGIIHRGQKPIQGDDNGHVGRPSEVSPAPPCPELFCKLRGPLPSLVLRTEDMWQKRETKVTKFRGLNPGFQRNLSPP